MKGTSRPENISTRLQRIAKLAKEAPDMVFTTLAHHIDIEFLQEAYRLTRKSGAPGVDGLTAEEYEENLHENLLQLLNRFQSGTYKAPPVKRVYVPKGDGQKLRPIGIPTFEDKVLQRAVAMILEAIYEQDFLDCSYGYRPSRSPHGALKATWEGLMAISGGWVVEIDIKDFFGTLNHSQLRGFLDQRVRDGIIRRTIDKWLKAGVLENGRVSYPETGAPQGGVASPALSNIYLHEVIDIWFADVVLPRLEGKAHMVRFADDILCIFSSEKDARKVLEVLPKRFARFGLTLHPDKTRLVRFTRPPKWGKPNEQPENGSFDYLGFTHYWRKSRRGNLVVYRKTAHARLTRALRAANDWCQEHRHEPLMEQHQTLKLKLQGHYNYYGITGNARALSGFHYWVRQIWYRWLNRRAQKRTLTWSRFQDYLARFPLPPPKVMHSAVSSAANP